MSKQNYTNNYLRFRITGITNTGKFIDHPEIKVRTTKQLKDCFKRLQPQLGLVHKIYIKRHPETKIIIGIDIQAKQQFDYEKFLTSNSKQLFITDKLERMVNNREYWNTVKYCLLRNREILNTPTQVNNNRRNASADDRFRYSLRRYKPTSQPTISYKPRKGV